MAVAHLELPAGVSPQFDGELLEALQSCGFVILRGHGIAAAELEAIYRYTKALFDLPVATKHRYQCPSGGERGYTAFGRERARDHAYADLKEFWHIGPELDLASPYRNLYPANLWPVELPGFSATIKRFYHHLSQVAQVVLDCLGRALQLHTAYFPTLIKDGNSVLRLLHYPAQREAPPAGHLRAAPHADINLITLLVSASEPGLELLDRRGQWQPVDAEAGELIVDTGDMMALITNGQLPATTHRVVNPPGEAGARYSLPFFVHPHSGAKLSPLPQCVGAEGPRFEPITAGDFLQQRLRENGLKSTS